MALPLESIIVGRGTHKGPQAGNYITLVVSGSDLASGETAVFKFPMPFDFRIVENAVIANNVSGSTAQYAIVNGASTLIAARDWPASDTSAILDPSDAVFLDAGRDGVKGDIITVTIDSNGSGVLADYSLTITLYSKGHVVASEDND